jgi:bifunctional pyridoxal-dependent enzyme with beta-cystathionase and maltose regulon repressor activities
MKFDFDTVIPRRNTNSIKYDFAEKFGKPADVLPMWVADMDFQTPPAVREALAARAGHGNGHEYSTVLRLCQGGYRRIWERIPG